MNFFNSIERYEDKLITIKKSLGVLLLFDLNGNQIKRFNFGPSYNDTSLPNSTNIFDIDFYEGNIYATGIKSIDVNDSITNYDVVLKSTDFGETWEEKVLEPQYEMQTYQNYLYYITVDNNEINIISNYRFYSGDIDVNNLSYMGLSDEIELAYSGRFHEKAKIIRHGSDFAEILGGGRIYRMELGKKPKQKASAYAEKVFYINNKYYCLNKSSIFITDN